MEKTEILNLNISTGDLASIVSGSISLVEKRHKHYICVPNAYLTVVANRDEKVREIINGAEFVIPDGMPLVWYSKTKKNKLTRRISGFDIFFSYCKKMSEKKMSCYFFGGKGEDTIKRIKKKIDKDFSDLEVKGYFIPPFVKYFRGKLKKEIIDDINRKRPDVVWVGLSAPKQEKWIKDNIGKIDVGMCCGIGAVFDFYSGSVKRAPGWMQRSGLEWLYRMFAEPERLLKKYLVYNTRFIILVISDLLKRAFGIKKAKL